MCLGDLSSAALAALTAGVVRPRRFFEAVLYGTTLRYWTGSYDIEWDSKTWLGDGVLKRVGDISSSSDLSPDSVEIELAGEPSALISLALNSVRLNQVGTVWLGLMDDSNELIVDPCWEFSGLLDTVELEDNVDEATLVLTFESRLVSHDQAKEYQYNHETQRIFYPNDLGFEYSDQMRDWSGFVGKPNPEKKPKKDNGSPRKKGKKKKSRRRKR